MVRATKWAKEGKKEVDWQKLLPPRGFQMGKDCVKLCATGGAFVYAAMTGLMVR